MALSLTWVRICFWERVCTQKVGAGVQDVLISRLFQACGCFFFWKPIKLKEGHPLPQFLGFPTLISQEFNSTQAQEPKCIFVKIISSDLQNL